MPKKFSRQRRKSKAFKSKYFLLKREGEITKEFEKEENLKATILLEKRRKPTKLWD